MNNQNLLFPRKYNLFLFHNKTFFYTNLFYSNLGVIKLNVTTAIEKDVLAKNGFLTYQSLIPYH